MEIEYNTEKENKDKIACSECNDLSDYLIKFDNVHLCEICLQTALTIVDELDRGVWNTNK